MGLIVRQRFIEHDSLAKQGKGLFKPVRAADFTLNGHYFQPKPFKIHLLLVNTW